MLRHLAHSIIVIGALAASAHGLANALVVRATGPSAAKYIAGKPLSSAGKITLKAGDQLTILDAKGTRIFTGPGVFDATSASATDKGSVLIAMIRNSGARQVRTGAVRGDPANNNPARPSSIWSIDVNKSGNMCVTDPAHVLLWRGDNSAAASMTLKNATRAESSRIDWRIGQSVREWPLATQPIVSGESYKVQFADQESRSVTLKVIAPSQGPSDTAKALIANGCAAQLDTFIAAGQ